MSAPLDCFYEPDGWRFIGHCPAAEVSTAPLPSRDECEAQLVRAVLAKKGPDAARCFKHHATGVRPQKVSE